MRIAIGCSSAPDRGSGISAYAKDLATALRGMDVDVHFVSPSPTDTSWMDRLGIQHVSTSQYDDPMDRSAMLLDYFYSKKIDGIINNDNALVQSVAPGVQCAFISIGHMSKRSIARLACYQSQWTDYVVAISDDMRRIFVGKYKVPFVKCPVVFTGVSGPDAFPGRSDARTGDLRLIYGGGFDKRLKGADLLVKAVRSGQWNGIHLDWYGSVPPNVAEDLAKYPHVTVHGLVPRERFLAAMRESDVLLLPSRYEGCPITMIEAMSFGVVPITTDGIGAMRSLITSGREGFVCDLHRWDRQAVEAVVFLRDNPAVLGEMRRAAWETYTREFTSDVVARRLLDLIERPTVDRRRPVRSLRILRWHRPLRADGLKAPLLDRLHYRCGRLRSAGTLMLDVGRAGQALTNP